MKTLPSQEIPSIPEVTESRPDTAPQDALSASRECRPPIAILGVPFDNVTKAEALNLIERMVASRQPHYLVTPNLDFLVQARADVELRRILFEAHLVVCDGTPLVWASRWLGNPLPERVAGADLVPLLIELAARKGYRLFLLGATPEASQRAVCRLQARHPGLIIAGSYSPPFNKLLEMDHVEIRRRILAARPDVLLVSLGCPKQEKWIAMNYHALGVPVTAGVGATIDFLAGQVRRAPAWMQRSGTEWVFRLAQEPRRLVRRYAKDLWGFGSSILPQWWHLQFRAAGRARERTPPTTAPGTAALQDCRVIRLPAQLDCATVRQTPEPDPSPEAPRHLLLDLSRVRFIDSTGIGWLIRLQKTVRRRSGYMVLVAPGAPVYRALALMRLTDFFPIAADLAAAEALIRTRIQEEAASVGLDSTGLGARIVWRGEITAANAPEVWQQTRQRLSALPADEPWTIDLEKLRFIDSSGLGLMVRLKKLARSEGKGLRLAKMQPAVRNVLRLAQMEAFFQEDARPSRKSRNGALD
jgi:N-acetylglucosaminyldiphosphoundecaprenol N-acetyl-beta-D-mannosaminyltransferase